MLNDDSALPSRNYLHFLDYEHDVFGRRFAPHCLYFLYATRADRVEAYTILWVS